MTLAQLKGYADAHSDVEQERRYADAIATRIAYWGDDKAMNSLRPQRRVPDDDDEYDETGLAEELASFGFVEVP